MPSWSELWSQGNCSSDYECRWSFHQRSIWVNWRDTTGGQSHLKDRECTQSWVYCKFVNLFVHPDGFVRLYSHQNRAPPTATTDCQLLCESSIGIIVGRTLKPVFSHPATVLFSRFCWFISSYSFISHHIGGHILRICWISASSSAKEKDLMSIIPEMIELQLPSSANFLGPPDVNWEILEKTGSRWSSLEIAGSMLEHMNYWLVLWNMNFMTFHIFSIYWE